MAGFMALYTGPSSRTGRLAVDPRLSTCGMYGSGKLRVRQCTRGVNFVRNMRLRVCHYQGQSLTLCQW